MSVFAFNVSAIGWVCVAHRRWIGRDQLDIRQLPELVAAERRFRSTLVSRQIHIIALSTLEERGARPEDTSTKC